jgi:Carboxypeptidase regulatory-like domain
LPYNSRMRYFVLGALLLFSLGDGCSSSPGVVGVQDYGQVTGRVLDAMTNRPISAALVSVGSLYTASADARGAFTLTKVPAGDQTVTARAPGYTPATADITIEKDKGASIGYIRLVPLIHPAGLPTLAPPATPTPKTSPSTEPTEAPAPGVAPTPGGEPNPAAAPPSSAAPSPAAPSASPSGSTSS